MDTKTLESPAYLGIFGDLMKHGILVSEGQKWKTQRRTLSTIFHYDFLKDNIPLIQQICEAHFDKLAQKKDLTRQQLVTDFQEIAGEIIGKLFFGDDMANYEVEGESLALALPHLVTDCFAANIDPLQFIFGPGYIRLGLTAKHRSIMRRIKMYHAEVLKIAKDRKKQMQAGNPPRKDLLGLMLQKQAEEGEEVWPDVEIVAHSTTFILGGVDTTSRALCMGLYLLDKNHDYIDKLRAEVDMFYSKNVTNDDLNKMELMQAFMKETFRLYSPAKSVFMREAIQDHKIGDVKIRKGDLVWPMLHSNDMNETYYEDATNFKPERWMEKTLAGGIPTYHFSSGARNCIGQHFSNIESKIINAEFLKRFDFNVSEGYKLKMFFKNVYEPKEEIPFDLSLRQFQRIDGHPLITDIKYRS